MTRPEPAGVGTADEMAERIVREHETMWAAFGGYEVTRRDAWPPPLDELASAIAAAITASRRQAKEEDAKIIKAWEQSITYRETDQTPLLKASNAAFAKGAIDSIRSSINPPGGKE